MPWPVSVQICTLNEAANIGACLEAVLRNEPEEVLVVDGGSVDDTVAVASKLGVRVLTPGLLGLGPSRQLGWRSTACPLVAMVDADDRLPSDWLSAMVEQLREGDYAALQGCLRSADFESWWSRGWDQYFVESIKPVPKTSIVGRPALFRKSDLDAFPGVLPSLDEDTHLSRWFHQRGLRQGIGNTVSHRHVETSWTANAQKWRSYGRGYREFVNRHPERKSALYRHIFFTIPFRRSLGPVTRGHLSQPLFNGLMAFHIVQGWLRSGTRQGTATTSLGKQGNGDL